MTKFWEEKSSKEEKCDKKNLVINYFIINVCPCNKGKYHEKIIFLSCYMQRASPLCRRKKCVSEAVLVLLNSTHYSSV